MTEPKDSDSFFRKVARFVANPTSDWTEIHSRHDDPGNEAAKAELKAMVERKRRNDFVRKRELDMLRRIRREGLSPDQLAALGASASKMDEVERNLDSARMDLQVRAKIDEIEQQMVGETRGRPRTLLPTGSPSTLPAQPSDFLQAGGLTPVTPAAPKAPPPPTQVPTLNTVAAVPAAPSVRPAAPAPVVLPRNLSEIDAQLTGTGVLDERPTEPPTVPPLSEPPVLHLRLPPQGEIEVNELVHDAELDEAVIAFANGDYSSCEASLKELTAPGGVRHQHADTWLVLFDLYRATGQHAPFEALALDYAQLFGLSAPQWFSMPKAVAEQQQRQKPKRGPSGDVAWACPAYLDAEAVDQLDKASANHPLPWVLDWKGLDALDIEACARLQTLFKRWAQQVVDVRWLSGDHFMQKIADMTPVGARDVDPALWMLRLEMLRLANRPDQFDEVAIDYCVTYEVSPPQWEKARCTVRVSTGDLSSVGPNSQDAHASSLNSESAASSFLETSMGDLGRPPQPVKLELLGQLQGDIGEKLSQMTQDLGVSAQVEINCAALIRLDFMAAGDLLNWVLTRRSENRNVVFLDAHRLVALFFGAMGINEHARIKVRPV